MLKLFLLFACGFVGLIHGFDVQDDELAYSEDVYKGFKENYGDKNFVLHPGFQYALLAAGGSFLGENFNSAADNAWFKDLLSHEKELKNFVNKFQQSFDDFDSPDDLAQHFQYYGPKEFLQMFTFEVATFMPSFFLSRDTLAYTPGHWRSFDNSELFFVRKNKNDGSVKIKNWYNNKRFEDHILDIDYIQNALEKSGADSFKVFTGLQINLRFLHEFKSSRTQPGHFAVSPKVHQSIPMMSAVGQYLHGELPEMDAKFIVVPLKDRMTKFVIYMPNNLGGMKKIEDNIHLTRDSYLAENGKEEMMNLHLPSFHIKTMANFKQEFGNSKVLESVAKFLASLKGSEVKTSEVLAILENIHEGVYTLRAGEVEDSESGENHVTPQSEVSDDSQMPSFDVDRSFYFQLKVSDVLLTEGYVADPTAM